MLRDSKPVHKIKVLCTNVSLFFLAWRVQKLCRTRREGIGRENQYEFAIPVPGKCPRSHGGNVQSPEEKKRLNLKRAELETQNNYSLLNAFR